MKIKKTILIFLLGIIIGVAISPLTDKTPQEVILSPTPLTLAKTKKLTLPTSIEKVLGTFQQANKSSVTEKSTEPGSKISQFGFLTATPSAEAKEILKEKGKFNPSSYQGKITIAVFGDSMIDVMGTGLPALHASLQNYYPQAELNLFNYGVGAQNIEQGLIRLEEEYNYQGRNYPSLLRLNPDIVVLGSFSYNPFVESEDELYRHWAGLARLVDRIKSKTSAKIIILTDIAPNKEKFGQGPKGINWDSDSAWKQAHKIQQYLENTIGFAQGNSLPLVDSYHQTLLADGEGNLTYINPDDHIHQNTVGNILIGRLLTEEIFSLGLFK